MKDDICTAVLIALAAISIPCFLYQLFQLAQLASLPTF